MEDWLAMGGDLCSFNKIFFSYASSIDQLFSGQRGYQIQTRIKNYPYCLNIVVLTGISRSGKDQIPQSPRPTELFAARSEGSHLKDSGSPNT